MVSKQNMAYAEYDNGIKKFPKTDRNVTFEPSGDLAIDLAREEDREKFFDRFSMGGCPVYIIGATNNTGGDFNEDTKNAYIALKTEGKNALLGQWTDPDGRRFRDTSFAVSGIDLEQARFSCIIGW